MNELNKKDVYDRFINSLEWRAVRNAFVEGKKCKMCGSDVEIEAHHVRYVEGVKGYCDTSNLVPLCRLCHYVVHTLESEIKYGWARQNKFYLSSASFRLNLLGRMYEKTHVAGMSISTREYLQRVIDYIPENTSNIELKVLVDRNSGTIKMKRVCEVLKEEMDNCPVIDSVDDERMEW